MEIIQERLEREFGLDLITTCPTVVYNVKLKDSKFTKVSNPSDMPETIYIDKIFEPFIRAEIISYDDYVNCGGEQEAKESGKLIKMQQFDQSFHFLFFVPNFLQKNKKFLKSQKQKLLCLQQHLFLFQK